MSSTFGYCPECAAPGNSRERRPNGNDMCEKGHVYPSAKAMCPDPEPTKEKEMAGLKRVTRHLKLPVWAQEEINDYKRTILGLQKRIDVLEGKFPPSKVMVQRLGTDDDLFLEEHSSVRFLMENPMGFDKLNTYIDVRRVHNENLLAVNASHIMKVLPRASNLIYIGIEKS